MITRFISKILGKGDKDAHATFGKRADVPVSKHQINPKLVDERALQVVHTLKKAGYEAYIVGGAVRDLLVGLRPKDFDVATNATPEQVKSLFRRAFIIGRRFRIVHVVFGRGRENEVIEVSTFRAYLDNTAAKKVKDNQRSHRALEGMQHAVDASGRVLRDNVWGSQKEDAARRDFSINAMYYDPETQIVVDFHKGLDDVRKKTIRMIGNTTKRYQEDPVRIIRAVRFASKLAPLGFKLDKATREPLQACLPLLNEVPQSRLFDEMLKLLQTGHALSTIDQIKALGLQKGIYPLLTLAVERAQSPMVHHALKDTDRRVAEGKAVAPSFLLACLLWEDVYQGWTANVAQHMPSYVALQESIDRVFDLRIGDVSGRGKLAADMREIWMMQPRFEKRTGSSPFSMVTQLRYRAGYDFLRLRSLCGEVDEALCDWWQTFSTASDTVREDLIAAAKEEQRKNQTKTAPKKAAKKTAAKAEGGRVHRVQSSQAIETTNLADALDVEQAKAALPKEMLGDAPKKRRRRRRKPNGGNSKPEGAA